MARSTGEQRVAIAEKQATRIEDRIEAYKHIIDNIGVAFYDRALLRALLKPVRDVLELEVNLNAPKTELSEYAFALYSRAKNAYAEHICTEKGWATMSTKEGAKAVIRDDGLEFRDFDLYEALKQAIVSTEPGIRLKKTEIRLSPKKALMLTLLVEAQEREKAEAWAIAEIRKCLDKHDMSAIHFGINAPIEQIALVKSHFRVGSWEDTIPCHYTIGINCSPDIYGFLILHFQPEKNLF